ncbi:MAG TPA: NADH-quinone oxidoreductase subunit N [Candidatus Limnocylindria bacterium]|jgi:NADH-quinone oxidoreductase subunit N|nr:NADH-quinone oxidoreductase subunit N [Candidatus Limnocylindria bacterium]
MKAVDSTMSYLELLKLVSPETIVVVTALAVLAIGLATGRAKLTATISTATPAQSASDSSTAMGICSAIAALGLAVAVGTVLMLPRNTTLFGGMLVITPLTLLFKIICIALAFLAILLTTSEKALRHPGEYLALILFATVGLMLLVGSEELLMIFIGLELLGLSLYVMTAFDKTDVRSAEAGLKYFLFGSTSSAFTLFGISLIYGMTGTTSLAAISGKLATVSVQPLLAAGIVMTLIGFAFKIAAAPFHLWAPDAYQGAPVPSAAFIASASKVASFVVLGKIVLIGFAPVRGDAAWHAMIAGWSPMLAVLAALSILVGNLVALAQSNVRRLLAYSAVAHAGYTLIGLVAGGRDGFSAALFYATVYAITLVGAFGVVAVVRRETGGDDFSNFRGLVSRSPVLAACMSVFMLSLAGIPPLVGFFGKFYLFSAALRAGADHGLLWLVAVALLGSFISLYYYLIVLKTIFVDEPAVPVARHADFVPPALLPRATVAVLGATVLLLGIAPQLLAAPILAAVP